VNPPGLKAQGLALPLELLFYHRLAFEGAVTMRVILALGLGLFAVTATAQPADPIKARHEIMEQMGKNAKAGGAFLKGDVPYDAAKAAAIFKSMNDGANAFGKNFPPGSDKGKTEASPDIWAKPADWQAALAKFQKDTATAAASNPQTVADFGKQFGAVTSNCKSCHESFRVKKS
jgi:cytochrome c556